MQIYVRQIAGGRMIQLTDDATVHHRSPRWSADGSEIAYQRSDSVIAVVSALGGPARTLLRLESDSSVAGSSFAGATILGFDWSRDGGRIAYTMGWPGATYVQEVPGNDRTEVTRGEIHSVAFSPDSKWLAYVVKNPLFVYGTVNFANEGNSAIEVVPVGGGEPVIVAEGSALNVSPQWLPDGRGLLWVSDRDGARDIYQVNLSRSMAPTAPPRRITTGLDVHTFTLSRDGSRLVYASLTSSSNVWAVDLPADPDSPASIRDAVPITRGNQIIEAIGITRDGKTLVFDSNRGGNYDIYLMAIGDQEPVRLTTDPAPDFGPRFSPDGSTIVFHSQRFGNRDIFTIRTDGTGETRLTEDPEEQMNAEWSPDGEAVLYLVLERDEIEILSLVDGSVRVLQLPASYPRWSSAGDMIVSAGAQGLNAIHSDGGNARLLVPNPAPGFGPAWTVWDPDGRTIYYLAFLPSGWSGWSLVPGEEPRLILEFDDPMRQHTRYGIATDGRKLYLTLGSHESDVWVLELERE